MLRISRFTDSKTQDITLINLASVDAISEEGWQARLIPYVSAANFYIEGAKPWQEHDWVGKDVTIGGLRFHVRKRTQRCDARPPTPTPLPVSATRNIPKLLMTHFDHCDCGIHLMPLQSGSLKPGAELDSPLEV